MLLQLFVELDAARLRGGEQVRGLGVAGNALAHRPHVVHRALDLVDRAPQRLEQAPYDERHDQADDERDHPRGLVVGERENRHAPPPSFFRYAPARPGTALPTACVVRSSSTPSRLRAMPTPPSRMSSA